MTRAQRSARLRGIYAIVNESPRRDPVELTRAILNGGVRIVQYRAKNGIDPAHAQAMRSLTQEHDALFIINDDWRAVQTYRADGVHLGPEDALPEDFTEIRDLLPECLIGISCGTPQEARIADANDVDYIGVGSVYATNSKADAGVPIGIAGLREVAAQTRLPVAAIGGITVRDIPEIRASGVAMAAVISAIGSQADAREASTGLVRAWNRR